MTRFRTDVNKVDTRNVILPLNLLTNLIVDCMSCRHCRIGNTMNIRAVTTGIATQLSMCCTNELCTKCDEWSIMEPSMVDLDKLVDNKCDPYDVKKTGNKITITPKVFTSFSLLYVLKSRVYESLKKRSCS